ncbi:LAFE_0E03378g1_1 [Lachancea fermentati]|uniref:Succinate dehydrogenase assembly factor 2, mitochondrial n=1 Tax=Lachancea fermentati TaxID=4955 RepID=A0A1G4MCI4_LACFM|nr:LAFE_0E03378g1_1 [Lachancea fermentati]
MPLFLRRRLSLLHLSLKGAPSFLSPFIQDQEAMLSRTIAKASVRPSLLYSPCLAFVSARAKYLYSTQGKAGAEEDDVTMRVKVAPIKRTGESLDRQRARLVYQSRKRGILETDLLLSRFAAEYLKSMTPEELQEYDDLLNELDWDIYYWATKNYSITPLPAKWENSKVLQKLQEFSANKNKEILRMPDLSKY